MAGTKGLGKGLGALLGDDFLDTAAEAKGTLALPLSQVESCASQPRKNFDPDALADLADSIAQHGIIQPLTVRRLQSGYYQIIAGERRWRAARMAALSVLVIRMVLFWRLPAALLRLMSMEVCHSIIHASYLILAISQIRL